MLWIRHGLNIPLGRGGDLNVATQHWVFSDHHGHVHRRIPAGVGKGSSTEDPRKPGTECRLADASAPSRSVAHLGTRQAPTVEGDTGIRAGDHRCTAGCRLARGDRMGAVDRHLRVSDRSLLPLGFHGPRPGSRVGMVQSCANAVDSRSSGVGVDRTY